MIKVMDTWDEQHKLFARELRKKPTASEKAVWKLLRNKQVSGLKFRRQHVLENYVVDFYCHELCLVIEIDGDIHKQQKEYDAHRQALLEGKGYHFLRIPAQEADRDPGIVVAALQQYLSRLSPGDT